jgi:hypothetical protein
VAFKKKSKKPKKKHTNKQKRPLHLCLMGHRYSHWAVIRENLSQKRIKIWEKPSGTLRFAGDITTP